MRRIAWCPGILLLASWAVQAATPAEPLSVEFGAGAWVDVDATGKARVVEMDKLDRIQDEDKPGSISSIIKARLRERIESWQFEPPMKNGVAVAGRTHVNMAVVIEDIGSGDMRLRVKRANTGLVISQMPSFVPVMSEMGRATGWTAVVHLEISPRGHVTDTRLVDFKVFDGKKFVARPGYHDLSRAALGIIRQAEFEMEQVDGQPIAGGGDLPVQMCISGSAACSDATSKGNTDDENRAAFAATNPAIGLRTEVVDTIL